MHEDKGKGVLETDRAGVIERVGEVDRKRGTEGRMASICIFLYLWGCAVGWGVRGVGTGFFSVKTCMPRTRHGLRG